MIYHFCEVKKLRTILLSFQGASRPSSIITFVSIFSSMKQKKNILRTFILWIIKSEIKIFWSQIFAILTIQ